MKNKLALEQIAAARGTLTREYIENCIQEFQATYAQKDWQKRATLLSEDVIFEDTVGVEPPAIGRQQAEDYFQSIIAYGIEVEMSPEKIVVMGNEAFVLTRASWWRDNTPPEKLVIIHNFKFNTEGKMSHIRIAYDEGCLE